MTNKTMILEAVLAGLMRRYRKRVPDVGAILTAMVREGIIADESGIENDHIAFRSLGVPFLGIASLEKVFLHLGYTRRDRYEFAVKKLNAYWYAPPEPRFPRIFLSELRVKDLSEDSRAIIKRYTRGIFADPVDQRGGGFPGFPYECYLYLILVHPLATLFSDGSHTGCL